MLIRQIFRSLLFLVLFLAVVLLLAPEWSASASESTKLQSIVGHLEYDFLVWESDAFLNKGETILSGSHQYLDEQTRKTVVLDYLELIRKAQTIEGELNRVYSDPDILDPALESQDLQKELELTRATLQKQQLLAEAIVQEQVATILAEQQFDLMGQAWPPVLMHVTQVPSLLVVSPRDRIEKVHVVTLEHGLNTPAKEIIETSVVDDLDHSALVVPLGGIGTYPAMIIETGNINRLVEVVTHEWVHHWLTLHPLGFSYGFDPDLRIINETVASLVDQEIGQMVIERYYPEFLPPPQIENQSTPPSASETPEFDFQAELADTRIMTEKLLADGHIEDAEAYMEQRRREFLEHGYHIRKLNQAYFAFYGAYAAEPGGAQGGNPIGPMLREIQAHSPSVRAFLDAVAPITSLDDLKELHGRITPAVPAN